MKARIAAVMMLGLPLLTGCATHWTMVDRTRDALDIFTATVGVGAAAQVRLGPLPLGFVQNADMAGIRHGDRFVREFLPDEPEENNTTVVLGALGLATVMACVRAGVPPDGAAYFFDAMEYSDGYAFSREQIRRHKDDTFPISAATYQLEVVCGVGGTVRLGFNPGELLDFIMGWAGIDIFCDDIGPGAARTDPRVVYIN